MAFWPFLLALVLMGLSFLVGFAVARNSRRPIGYGYFINFRDYAHRRNKGFEVEYVRVGKNGALGRVDPNDDSRLLVEKKVGLSRFKSKPFPIDDADHLEVVPGRTWIYGLKSFYGRLVDRLAMADRDLFDVTNQLSSVKAELMSLRNDPKAESEYIQKEIRESFAAQRMYQSSGKKS